MLREEKRTVSLVLWALGSFFFFLFNPFLTMLSLGLTKATVVVAVRHGLQVLWSILLSWAVVGENVNVFDFIGSTLLSVGVVILIVESDHHSHQLGNIHSWASIIYLSISCTFCVVGGIIAVSVPAKHLGGPMPRILLSVSAGICGGLATVANKLLVETVIAEVTIMKDISLQVAYSEPFQGMIQTLFWTRTSCSTVYFPPVPRACSLCR